MEDENHFDPFHFHFTIPIPSIVVNRHDNREIGMNIENAEHVTHTVEQPSVSQATSSLQDMQINPHGSNVDPRQPIMEDTPDDNPFEVRRISDENQQDDQVNITVPKIVSNRRDNRPTGMHIERRAELRGGGRNIWFVKPTLEEIFGPDNIDQLLQEEKCHEAYVASFRHRRFDPAVFEFKDLVNHYRGCMLVGYAAEAIQTREKLKTILEGKIETTPNKIQLLADESKRKGKVMEAILFYRAAADVYGKQLRASLVGRIAQCVFGIKESVETFLSRHKNFDQNSEIVQKQVIPLMRDMREMIRHSAGDVSEEIRRLEEVWCLVYIDTCEELVDDWENRETTLKETIEILESVCGRENAGKHAVYGTCLYNLGVIYLHTVYLRTSRPDDASEYFRRAIAAFQQAENIDDEKKKECIERCEYDWKEATKRQSTSRD